MEDCCPPPETVDPALRARVRRGLERKAKRLGVTVDELHQPELYAKDRRTFSAPLKRLWYNFTLYVLDRG